MINPVEIVEFLYNFTFQEWIVLLALIGSFSLNYIIYRQNKEIAQNQNIYQNKQITAELICKARLEWMDKVRDLSAQWIFLVDEILKHDELKEVEEMLKKLNSVSRQLSLCFNPEGEQFNKIKVILPDEFKSFSLNSKQIDGKIYRLITKINDTINYRYSNNDIEGIKYLIKIKPKIIEVYDFRIREYLKNEWERVKRFH